LGFGKNWQRKLVLLMLAISFMARKKYIEFIMRGNDQNTKKKLLYILYSTISEMWTGYFYIKMV